MPSVESQSSVGGEKYVSIRIYDAIRKDTIKDGGTSCFRYVEASYPAFIGVQKVYHKNIV